ncbi:hypothetical protein MtrunA17_Chr7g0271641 [Medicago truncatula]|uniref:Uncharacterized protein n=1 Tax=Medicago truncatula TaxID=3880 RepID=A0A396H9F2_MEDTR|nr:hypothetical protein MtrunA17_Chr7g0271641 [Medicago truncatula]
MFCLKRVRGGNKSGALHIHLKMTCSSLSLYKPYLSIDSYINTHLSHQTSGITLTTLNVINKSIFPKKKNQLQSLCNF